MIGKKINFVMVSLLQLLVLVSCQCPDVFRTYTNDSTGEKIGLIRIPIPPKGIALHIRVVLSVPRLLPRAYRGSLDLANTLEESVEAIAEGKPLYYRVRFPIQNPIPAVTNITFNDEVYCTGPRVPSFVRTNFYMEHAFDQPEIKDNVTEQWLDDIKRQSSKYSAVTVSSPSANVELQETTTEPSTTIAAESVDTDEKSETPTLTTSQPELPVTSQTKSSTPKLTGGSVTPAESESATAISDKSETELIQDDSATTTEAETVTASETTAH